MQVNTASTGTPVLGMILKGYPRISETFISNEILLLERLGFSIRIFSMRHPREPFSHESVKQIRAEVDYLPQTLWRPLPRFLYHNILLALQKPGTYVRALRTAVRRFFRTRKSATLKHLLQAGYLVHRFLPGTHVVHLHAHFAHSPTSVALFASQLSGLGFSFTAHAKDIYTSHPEQLREKIAMARFVVTCTEYNRRHLTRLNGKNRKEIRRIYHGIDTDLFNGSGFSPCPEAPYRILTVARLTPKKGLPTVYRALKVLHDQKIPFVHTLIGDGDDREQILELRRSLGLENVTRWLGTQPHDVVLTHFRKAHLFVLGCRVAANGDRDGIPNVFLESMAMGVPVVSTRVSAVPEVVINEETGLLVSPENPQEMAQAILQLLTNAELRKRIIHKARKNVREVFDNKVLIRELAALLSPIVK